ncbi:hypothetical protein [Cohnella hongkongensis]|uniref:Uncharacterized protein n=1 Tax=Cohnella hongkongensis TaxID=178337 RepID=A0ABV9FIQ4_9BACL
MAKTDWMLDDTVLPEDLNQLGVEINANTEKVSDNLDRQPWEPVVLRQGVQIVQGGDVPAILHPTMQGRTLVNLLGRDGNCESMMPFTAFGAATSGLSATRFKYGSNSIKFTASNNSGFLMKNYSHPLDTTKQYVLGAWVYVESFTSGVFDLSVRNYGETQPRYGVLADNTKIGVWQFIYVKIPVGNTITTSGFSLLLGPTTIGTTGVYYVDGIRIYQLADDDFNAIGTTITGDAVDSFIPYVDDMKHVNAVYVENKGKNLVDSFSSGKWSFNTGNAASASVAVVDPGKVVVTTNGVRCESSCYIEVIPNTTYTFSCDHNGLISIYNETGSTAIVAYTPSQTITFNSGNRSKISVWFMRDQVAGTSTFSNPMLNIGSAPLPFKPQKLSYLYLPDCNLRSNVDGSIADLLYTDRQGKPRVTRRFREMALDGSMEWSFGTDASGFKSVRLPIATYLPNNITNTQKAIKFDGKALQSVNNAASVAAADQISMNNTDSSTVWLSVADTDSGWGESYTPTADEIRVYFNGWRMCMLNGAEPYTSGAKRGRLIQRQSVLQRML